MDDSILNRAKERINKDHPYLCLNYNNSKKKLDKIYSHIKELSFLKIIIYQLIFILLIILYTKFINVYFFNFILIDFKDTLKIFTTISITLVSMNLFVTNLLLTHLKEERDDLEKMINRKIAFKFITYYGFSIIILLVLLNIFYSLIPYLKSNILLFLCYEFVFFIYLIVDLYQVVFKFINKSERENVILQELKKEFYNSVYADIFKKIFKQEYNNFFTIIQAIPNPPKKILAFELNNSFIEYDIVKYKSKKIKYFRDLKLKKISLLKLNNPLYADFSLNYKKHKEDELQLFYIKKTDNVDIDNINNQFVFKSSPLFENEIDIQVLSIILNRINKSVKKGIQENLDSDLALLETLFKEYHKM